MSKPDDSRAAKIDEFADDLYEFLRKRIASWDAVDLDVEVDDWLVVGEVHFATGPDVGFSLDARTGELRCCEVTEADERWLPDPVAAVHVLAGTDPLADRVAAFAAAIPAARKLLAPAT